MQAHTSYLNQQVVEITGNLQNTGDRKLALVEINCIFYDPYGKVVLRQRVPIISRKMGGLAPGETKAVPAALRYYPRGLESGDAATGHRADSVPVVFTPACIIAA